MYYVYKTCGYVISECAQKGFPDTFDPLTIQSTKRKNWIAQLDIKTCLTCKENHGKLYGANEISDEEPPPELQWVEWIHVTQGRSHCKTCLKLDKCWFLDDRKPVLPQHPYCHCIAQPLPYGQVLKEATAGCLLSKFNPYLFDPNGDYGHGKQKMYESWGYTINDSEWLRQECERQGLEKYIYGEYTLGKLNKNGQRINIRMELPRRDKEGTVSFITGWMVYPDGHIQLITPYGGK